MKVLLIQPRSNAVGFTGLILGEPLGLEMIAGGLDRHDVKILDLRLRGAISWPMKVSRIEESHIRGS